jgi:hypothetical protein
VQLEERRLGNAAYQKQQFDTALHHYQRALAVVNFVVGQSPHDQAEVDNNKATVLLNMAAVHMALKVSRSQCKHFKPLTVHTLSAGHSANTWQVWRHSWQRAFT